MEESFGQFLEGLAVMERQFQDNKAEAGRWLPRLLELSGPDLSTELARHPELQPGISRVLLEVVDDMVHLDPARAHELTAAVIESYDPDRSLSCRTVEPYLRANAWTAYAGALRGLGRHLDALVAINTARDACRRCHANDWSTALAEVVEGQILHDMGKSGEALELIRHGAAVILFHGDVKRYVQVRMFEVLILWDAGDRTAAADVWRRMAWEAAQRGDAVFMAVLESAAAELELRHGGAEAAARLFQTAHDVFDSEGLTREAIRARRGMAEAAVVRGRLHEAISEYYKVQALSLAAGNLREAALAAAEIIELLLLTGRQGEVMPVAQSMVDVFTDAGQEIAASSWVILQDAVLMGVLIPETVAMVRRYFRKFVPQPAVKAD